MTPTEPDQATEDASRASIETVVAANRILSAQGILDAFGHVSIRHPHRTDRFLLSRNRAPRLVTASDVVLYDLTGEPAEPGAPRSYLERFIHAAIYAARPDVGAVVHSHSPALLPFGAVRSVGLQPLSHMAGFLGTSTPVFEIRDTDGRESDLLIRNLRLGEALSSCLHESDLVLMRGHGATAVGADAQQAVYHAIYAEANARAQLEAIGLGAPTYLTAGEAAAAAAANRSQIDRAWDYWLDLLEEKNGE